MSVLVDRMRAPLGRMIMCHMMADTHEELMEMADRLGLNPRWIQHPGTPKEHFDVSLTKRHAALRMGAVEASARDVHEMLKRKRAAERSGE